MITDEEFDLIADRYFTKIKRIDSKMPSANDADIVRGVQEMNEALERIREIRTIQRRQRGEEE